jgi:hypothetical protein
VESLAGWVFADLFLVLFLIGMGTQLTQVDAAPEPQPKPTPTVTATPTPTPTKPPAMRKEPVERIVTADLEALQSPDGARQAAEQAQLRGRITAATADLAGKRAAMVLLWGDASQPGPGIELATAAGDQLVPAQPGVFNGAAQKRVWWSQGSEGQIKLEIYLFE